MKHLFLIITVTLLSISTFASEIYLTSGEHIDVDSTRVYCEDPTGSSEKKEYKCAIRVCVKGFARDCRRCNFFNEWQTSYKYVVSTSASLANSEIRYAGAPFSNLACWDPDSISCEVND